MSSASSSGVRASLPNGVPAFSHALTASSVSERKTLPFDQQVARGSSCSSFATVVLPRAGFARCQPKVR